MNKIGLRTVILLGVVFCMGLFQTAAIAANDPENQETLETGATGLSGISFTVGPFLSDLRDESYVSRNKIITLGGEDILSVSLGALAHVPLLKGPDLGDISWAMGLSGGFALGAPNTDGGVMLNVPAALGGSFLFVDKDQRSLALTFGGIVKRVTRLHGYEEGKVFPTDGTEPTKLVYKCGYFFALTYNFRFPNRFNPEEDNGSDPLEQTNSDEQENTTGATEDND